MHRHVHVHRILNRHSQKILNQQYMWIKKFIEDISSQRTNQQIYCMYMYSTCNVNSNMNVLQCTHNIVHCYIITCTWTDLSLASVVYSLLPRDPMKENNRPVSPSLQDCCNVLHVHLVWKVIRVHVTQCTVHYMYIGYTTRGFI